MNMSRMRQSKLKAQIKAEKMLELEKKMISERKVREWQRMKKIEADEKMARHIELRIELGQRLDALVAKEKPKEIKKAISFRDWIKKKNEDFIEFQKNQKKKPRSCFKVDNFRCGWVQGEPRKPKLNIKPDPLEGGLNNFWGTTIVVTSCKIEK